LTLWSAIGEYRNPKYSADPAWKQSVDAIAALQMCQSPANLDVDFRGVNHKSGNNTGQETALSDSFMKIFALLVRIWK